MDNTPDSVFCSHGAGVNVKWHEVKDHMHVDSGLLLRALHHPAHGLEVVHGPAHAVVGELQGKIVVGLQPCANQEEAAARFAYDPERDVDNTPDSVFCSHGAGVNVKWMVYFPSSRLVRAGFFWGWKAASRPTLP